MRLCIIASLTACGNDTKKTYTEEDLATLSDEELDAAMKASAEAASQAAALEAESIAANRVPVEPKQEIIDAEWYSGMVQFNDIIVQLPIRLSELQELGFDYEVYDKSKDYLFSEGESESVIFYLNGEKLFTVSIQSDVEGFHTLEEINPLITEISIMSIQMSDQAKALFDIYFPGGIKLGDSYTVIEEKLGKPYQIDSNMTYQYGSQFGSLIRMNIMNNKDTQEITMVSINKMLNLGDINDLSAVTIEDLVYGDINISATLQFLPEYIKHGRGNIESLILHENNVYSINLYANVLPAITYVEPLEEKLYEETREDGTYRMIALDYVDGVQYCVKKGDNVVEGRIIISNYSVNAEENYAEMFLENLIEIVNSIGF